MKKFASVALVCAVVLLCSCEPAATFDEPQPNGVNALESFPNRLQGRYVDSSHSSIVTITKNLLTRQYFFEEEYKDSTGVGYKMVGDTLIEWANGTKEKVRLKGDALFFQRSLTDTIFQRAANCVLKKYKGYYFLNKLFSDNAWEVKKMWFEKGTLIIGSISNEDDLSKLKEIKEIPRDTVSTRFSLTRKEFKKFVNDNGFGEEEKFYRVKE